MIAAEVMMASRHEDDIALVAVKDRLLAFFNAQMDLRRRLIEVNSSSMELQLERSRNDLIVKRFLFAINSLWISLFREIITKGSYHKVVKLVI